MKPDTFTTVIAQTNKATSDLLVRKNAEYAGHADVLMNFKRNAEKQGQTPLQVWKQYYAKHADSIDTYFRRVEAEATRLALDRVVTRGREVHEDIDVESFRRDVSELIPQALLNVDAKLSEPIEGRFYDIINYCHLGIALLHEGRGGAL